MNPSISQTETARAHFKWMQMNSMTWRTNIPTTTKIKKAYKDTLDAFNAAGVKMAGPTGNNAGIHERIYTDYQKVRKTFGYDVQIWNAKGIINTKDPLASNYTEPEKAKDENRFLQSGGHIFNARKFIAYMKNHTAVPA